MTPRRWYAIATLMMLVAVPALSQAATNRVLNGDCEEAGDTPDQIPQWSYQPAFVALRADALGTDQSAACVVVGAAVLQSDELFAVTAGETLEFSFDAWEVRNELTTDACSLIFGDCEGTAGDAVGAIEFVDVDGKSPGQVAIYVDGFPGDQYIHYSNAAVVVPAGAVYARVLLGGSLAFDVVDPLLFGFSTTSATSVTAFDNVFVGN